MNREERRVREGKTSVSPAGVFRQTKKRIPVSFLAPFACPVKSFLISLGASLRFDLLLLFAVLAGCGTASHTVVVKPYVPEEKSALFSPGGDPFVLWVAPVRGSNDKLWYSVINREWFLEREPPVLIRGALMAELESMGFTLVDNPEKAEGRLDAEVTWFSPDGGKPLSAGVIVSLSLYGPVATEPLWRGRLHGGRFAHAMPLLLESEISEVMGEMLSEAIGRAIGKLRWDPTFPEGVRKLRE